MHQAEACSLLGNDINDKMNSACCILRRTLVPKSNFWLVKYYSITSKVFAKSFPAKKPTLLFKPLLNNHDCEKHVAFNSNYIVLLHESPGLLLCLILGIPSFGLDDCLNPPLHALYEIIQYILLN